MISMTVKGKLVLPKIRFTKELEDIAQKIIIPEIHSHMVNEESLTGEKYRALAKSTLTQKARKGQSSKILEATGKLKKSIFHKPLGKYKVMISIKPIRKEIGQYLQIDGIRTKTGKRYFEFFGINDKAEKRAIDYMELQLRKQIKNG